MKHNIITVILLLTATAAGAEWFVTNSGVIRSVTLTTEGKIEVIRTQPTGTMYPEGGGSPDYAYKDIYITKDGKIVLEKTLKGRYYPESMQRVPDKYQWNDEVKP